MRKPNAKREANPFASELARAEKELVRGAPLWLQRLRKTAMVRFRELGFPSTRDEEWRQTNVSPISGTPFRRAPEPGRLEPRDLQGIRFGDLRGPRIVFLNGHYAPDLSSSDGLPSGVWVGSLAEALRTRPQQVQPHLARHALHEDRSFTALNTALFHDGGFLLVPPGLALEEPIHLLYATSPPTDDTIMAHPRTLIVVGDRCRVVVTETYVALQDAPYFTNAVSEIVIGASSAVTHCRVQQESRDAYHVAHVHSRQDRDSRFLSLNVSLGSALARNEVGVVLDGEGAECTLNGLYLVDGKQHVDNHTTIDHAQPNCLSHEMYKGVLSGAGRAVFNGRIIVRPGAQKTDAKQSNRNLLLSDDAVVHTRPQLEIYANDVKCTHGATIGHLDEDALFYLRSRGIGRQEAQSVLIQAFTSSVLRGLAIESLREALEAEVLARLEGEGTP